MMREVVVLSIDGIEGSGSGDDEVFLKNEWKCAAWCVLEEVTEGREADVLILFLSVPETTGDPFQVPFFWFDPS